MFGGGSSNPYDDIVGKTTDENLTAENWELILNLCDKVQDEGQDGAHNVIAAVLKRLSHRNPNVQLYALSLSESLSKNCDIQIHREIASRAFTQGLEKLIVDRTTHDKVRQRALALIAMWTEEFENDPTLGIMEDCYKSLEAKNYRFKPPEEPLPPTVDDEIRRKEEEDLQRVLALSIQDKGGRGQWDYNELNAVGSSSSAAPSTSHATSSFSQSPATYPGGYTPAATRSVSPQHVQTTAPVTITSTPTPVNTATGIVTRVRALHTFEPTEPGELGFEKGEIIKVVDRGYKDWWRGQLKGRTGIFPVNYVEAMPEPTAAELSREAEQEAAVFAQAVNVEKLLTMLRALDPGKDNLADNEEIQELYRSSMALRPKIVKLIDKYSQKRADLVSMNETFVRARTIFDRMMEESLARHSGLYGQPQGSYRPPAQGYSRQESYNYVPPAGYPSTPGPAGYPGAPQPYYGPSAAPYAGQPQHQPQAVYSGYGPQLYPTQHPQQHAPHAQQAPTPQESQSSPEVSTGPQQDAHQASHPGDQQDAQQLGHSASTHQTSPHAVQSQPEQQSERQVIQPYVYDPNTTYADPNVQAWAQYYAKGGKDLAGAVYFISVPGVTDDLPPPQQQLPDAQRQQTIEALEQHYPAQIYPVQQQQQQPVAGVVGGGSVNLPSPYPEDQSSQRQASVSPQQYSSPQQPYSSPAVQEPSLSIPRSPVPGSQTPSWVLPKPPNAKGSASQFGERVGTTV